MKRKRFSEEQIVGVLRQADAGRKPDEWAREHSMLIGTFYAEKAKFGGMSVNEAQRLKALEEENKRLKTLVAALSLDVWMLQSVVEKKLSAAEKRREVARLGQNFSASQRPACRFLGQSRCTNRHSSRSMDVTLLLAQVRAQAYAAPRNSYRCVWDALQA